MKQALIGCLTALLLSFTVGRAQTAANNPPPTIDFSQPGTKLTDIISALQSSLVPGDDTVEGGLSSQIAEFARIWGGRVDHNDSSGNDMFQQYLRYSLQAAQARIGGNACAAGGYAGNWVCLGPDSFANQTLGRIFNVYAAPGSWGVIDTLIVSGNGGIWRSTNFGLTWNCISDNAPIARGIVSPRWLSVSPLGSKHIYAGSSTYLFHVRAPQGLGYLNYSKAYQGGDYGNALLVTTDGGANWKQEILPFHTPATWADSVSSARPFFAPNGKRVYAFRDSAIFCKKGAGPWQGINPASILSGPYYWWEMKFVPNSSGGTLDSNHFFATTHGKNFLVEAVYNTINGTHTFTNVPFPFSIPRDTPICITIPTSNMLYAAIGHDMWRYNITQKTWKIIAAGSIPGGVSNLDAGMEASRVKPSILYLCGTQAGPAAVAYSSSDTGHTFTAISRERGDPTHCDVRGMYLHTATNTPNGVDDQVFFASDGGIFYKPKGVDPTVSGDLSCRNLNGKGLACGQFMGIGTSEITGAALAGQADNGEWGWEPNKSPAWNNDLNGDAGESVASRTEVRGYVASSGTGFASALDERTPNGGRSFVTNNITYSLDPNTDSNYFYVPMWADQSGGTYVGRTRMWRILPNSNNFGAVSGTGLIPPFSGSNINLAEYKVGSWHPKMRAMSLSQYFGTPTGYVLYEDGAIFHRYDNGTILKYKNAFIQTPKLGFTGTFPVTDITCDVGKPERVWISCGNANLDNPLRYRVMYSPDAGEHWLDVSKGLPAPLPVTHIIHHEGSPYVYASTDAGMYRLDMSTIQYSINDPLSAYNTVQWTCFNKGATGQPDFPMQYVSDLEINYCQGKLYAATYGRGIWSTDIMNETAGYNPAMGDYAPDPRQVITSNTTWNSDKWITSGVWIKNGATLTIQNNGATQTVIHMPKNGSIVVDPGAKIIVNGARITNDCGVFWKGILVMGKPNMQQTAANQGTAVITNGAVIEHARLAVSNGPESINPGNAGNGGIVYADNSFFRNNGRSVGFGTYHNKFPGLPNTVLANVSRFDRCTFEITSATAPTGYRGEVVNYPFQTHVALNEVEGVQFLGCKFLNNSTQTNTKGSGHGIASWNAQYSVNPVCTSSSPAPYGQCPPANLIRSTFSGFLSAVDARGDNLNQYNAVTVDYADFDKSSVGVYGDQAQNVNVWHSAFTVGNASRQFLANCMCHVGVFLQNSHSFRIEENTFTGVPGPLALSRPTGVRIDESGVYNNVVYRNTFNTLENSSYNRGKNANNPSSTLEKDIIGLQFQCNTFNRTSPAYPDIYNVGAPANHPKGQICIRKWQGSPTTPAGNLFYTPTSEGGIANDVGIGMNYYHNGPNSKAIGSANTYPPTAVVTPILVSAGRNCPSRFDPRAPRTPDNQKAQFLGVRPRWEEASVVMDQRIDGGNTATLQQQVVNSNANTAVILHDQLMGLAPYVSERVLRSVGSGAKLSSAQYMHVLMATPDVSADGDFLDWLAAPAGEGNEEANAIALSADEINALRNNPNTFTDRTALQTTIVETYDSMMSAGMEVINLLKQDTTSLDLDTLCGWYEQMPVLWTQYASAWARIGNNTPDAAAAVMNAIPTKFALSAEQMGEYNSYKDLMDLLTPYVADGKTVMDLGDADLATVRSIAARDHGEASVTALTIVQKVTDSGARWTCQVDPVQTQDGQRRTPAAQSATGSTAGGTCTAYPNPAKETVTFSYNLAEQEGSKPKLVVTSTAGVVAFQAELPEAKGTVRWDARAVAAGVYLYRIENEGKLLASGKLTIVK